MKTREEVAKFMELQMSTWSKDIDGLARGKGTWHYGKLELRDLMDFMYGGPPASPAEEVFEPLRLRNAKVGKWRD